MNEYRKIAVWQTAFLGDAVLTLPLVSALKERYPAADIHLYVRAGFESLFTGQPELASVHGFAKRGVHKSLGAGVRYGREIGAQGFDLFVSAHTSLRSALVARATGIGRRIGYSAPWYNRLVYTDTVDRRFDSLEEIERLLCLGKPLGILPPAPEARLVLPGDVRQEAAEFWATLPEGRPVLGIHPGSTWPTKCWPVEYFAEVAAKAADAGAMVLVFAGPGEEAAAAAVTRGLEAHPRVRNLSGSLSLLQLAAWLGRLDAYLTNDSGPMHVAWTQGTPVVAVFGPTVRSLGFFPRGDSSQVVEADLDCRPCGLHGHKECPKGHHDCMRTITPERVWDSVRIKLGL